MSYRTKKLHKKKEWRINTINPLTRGDQIMKKGEKLIVVGCSGAGGPAAMMAKKLMPEVDVTVIRKEKFFIVR